jgi:predicted neutral ceramidase superfamily lipid hydrolase
MPRLRLSSVVLLAIAAIGTFVLAAIYGYILTVLSADLDTRLWWIGFVSTIFAVAFYLLYAATADRRVLRPLSGAFFVISVGGFYASIFTNQDAEFTKLVWAIVLSILVVAALVGIYVMSREGEADAVRHAQRRLTP